MTLSVNSTSQKVTLTGTSMPWALPMVINLHTDIQVWLRDTSVTPASETLLSEGVGSAQYTISGAAPSFSLSLNTALTGTQSLVVKRVVSGDQNTHYTNTGPFQASDYEASLDKITMAVQQLTEGQVRALKFRETSTTISKYLPDPSTGAFLTWDSSGNIVNVPPPSVAAATGTLLAANNLSDVASAPSARTNLGLGTAATQNSASAVWNANEIQGTPVSATAIADGKVLVYRSGTGQLGYEAQGLPALTTGHVFIGNGLNVATDQPLTGDLSITSGGVTTVATVGASTAANIHTAEVAANAATNLNTASTIVKRDASGNFSAGTISATFSGSLTGNVTGNVSGTALNITGVTNIANGGTGAVTQAAAMTALAGVQSAGKFLRSDGTNTSLANIQVADVPTLNQSTTGTASNITGVAAIANGGTGQTTAATAANSLLPTQTGNAGKALKTDGSGTLSWGSAASGVNYASSNPDAESGISGFAVYQDTAGVSPVNGNGSVTDGTPITFTASATSPLRGAQSFLITQPNSHSVQGEGVRFPFTIDSADQAKMLQVGFDFNASSTFVASSGQIGSDSDIELWVYDVTNSVLIPISPRLITANGANNFTYKGTFQTSSNSTSYRLLWHCATTSANATGYKFKFDNLYIGPQVTANGAALLDTIADAGFTPSAGFGTVTSKSVTRQRVGDSMAIGGGWTAGTSAATVAYLQLPSGYALDTSKLASGQMLGTWRRVGTAATSTETVTEQGAIFYDGATTNQVFFAYQWNANAFVKANVTSIIGTGDTCMVEFSVPILGWSSTVLMSSDTDTRVVTASYAMSSAVAPGANTQINYDTKLFDSHSAVTTGAGAWKFTAPVSGYYDVAGCVGFSSGTAGVAAVYKNGSAYAYLGLLNTTVSNISYSTTLQLNAGDFIDIRPTTSMILAGGAAPYSTNIVVNRRSGPAAIAATESVGARYFGATATLSASDSTITYTTKDWDSHGAYSFGTFTVPVSGKYQVNAKYVSTDASGTLQPDIGIYVNGVVKSQTYAEGAVTAATNNADVTISDIVSCLAGDQITIRGAQSGTTPTIVASNTRNSFSIARVGN